MNESTAERFRRLEPLLDRALELEGAEREAFLRTCAGIHPDLIADLRRALSDEDTLPPIGAVAAEVTASPATDRRGLRAGPWRLTDKIGRGGMGTVYLAERADGAFEKRAAVKLLRSADPRFREQLERERQVLARLDHPGIARLIDGGLMRDDQPFLVMELAAGENLDHWITRAQPDLRRRLRVFVQICEAVAYAHTHLIVHRDLKPSNIRVDAQDQVKLLDFGIAKLLDTQARGDTRNVALTPEYAAPEQLGGGTITTRTDVYALGALLYQLLAGRTPHPPFDGNWAALVSAVCDSDVAPPSAAARGQAQAPVPPAQLRGDLDAIALRALAREPARRYPGADALAEDVRRWLDGRPVHARPLGVGARALRWLRRHRLPAALGAAALLLLLAGTAATAWQAHRVSIERDLARLEARRSEAVREYLLLMFREAGADVPDGPAVSAKALLDSAASRIEDEFSGSPEVRLVVLATLGELYIYVSDYTGAEPLLRRFMELEDASAPLALRVQVRVDLAEIALRRGEREAACAQVGEALALLDGSESDLPYERASALGVRGQCRRMSGDLPAAIEDYRASLALHERVSDAGGRAVASAESNLAGALMFAGRYDEALTHFQRALMVFESSGRGVSIHAATTLNNLAALTFARGRLDEARTWFQRALTVHRAAAGESASMGALLTNQGRLYTLLGHEDDAARALDEGVRLLQRFAGEDSLDAAQARLARSDLAIQRGQLDAARDDLDAARAVFEARLPEAHPLRARIVLSEADWAAQRGDSAAARAQFDRGIEALRAAGSAGALYLAPALCQSALRAAQWGESARAAQQGADCAGRAAQLHGEAHWQHAMGQAIDAAMAVRGGDAARRAAFDAALERLAALLGRDNPRLRALRALLS